MKTQIFNKNQLRKAAELILHGELVAFPTETVYGLGANAFDKDAVKKIFIAKNRPSDNPLIVHVASLQQAESLAFFNDSAKKLVKRFWPGPLTIVLKKKNVIPDEVTASLESVAIRMPSNKLALKLIQFSKFPIAAPSANISGKPSGTSFQHVYEDLNSKVAGIIKSCDCEIGLESTVVDLTSENPLLLRPGAITFEELKKIFPNIKLSNQKTKNPKSPGMKYRHYSPKPEVILFEKPALNKIKEYKKKYEKLEKKTAIINISSLDYAAKTLFKKFRVLDAKNVDYILVGGCEETGLGLALMNRLRKAASLIVK